MCDMKTYKICYLCEMPTPPLFFNKDSNISDICNQCAAEIIEAKRCLHKRIIHAMKFNNKSHIWNYLPYNREILVKHFEDQFESWMSWNNHGAYFTKLWRDNDFSTWTWQVDHIIPQSRFYFNSVKDEDFYKCWSLDNLRPLSSKENNIKRHK